MSNILKEIYYIINDATAMQRDRPNAGIDLVYAPRGNRFVILTDGGEFYQVQVTHISQAAFVEFRKETQENV